MSDQKLAVTPLHSLHLERGARMVAFAGTDMPLQYPTGIIAEHLHTRQNGGLFDVSHMGQIRLLPRSGKVADAAQALERLVPADLLGLAAGRQRYALLTNPQGGILDDLMVANLGDALILVVNAGCKQQDLAYLQAELAQACEIQPMFDHGLIALQGPGAELALARLAPEVASMRFLDARRVMIAGARCLVTRSGYTGEDGFEIGMRAEDSGSVATALLDQPGVLPAGLGARDSLRLEAGLCLYGSDIDTETTPVEAALEWSIGKSRRAGGSRAGGFPGAETILNQLAHGAAQRRVGLLPEGRAPVRSGTPIFAFSDLSGAPVGTVRSGAFGPSLAAPVAMGMVGRDYAAPGTALFAELRGRSVAVKVEALPFVAAGFKRTQVQGSVGR